MSRSTKSSTRTPGNGDRTPVFFERALNHCYWQIEQMLELTAKTPLYLSKKINQQKARLQREAEFLNRKLKEFR